MSNTHCYVFALLASLVASGCDKKSDAPTVASAAPSSSAPAASGGVCPPSSSGKGTADEPCIGTGRVLEAKWTGKTNKKAVFSVTNKLKYTIDFVQAVGYYYDASGKLLEVVMKDRPKYPEKIWSGSGGLFSIGPGETKEIELGWSSELAPKGTKTIEVEFNKVGWTPPDGKDEIYWENNTLIGLARPMGGNK